MIVPVNAIHTQNINLILNCISVSSLPSDRFSLSWLEGSHNK